MDNVITPALPPAAGLVPVDKPVTGQIAEVPPALNNLQVGDSLLLQVMFDSSAFKLNTSLTVNLFINNRQTPLNLKFDQPLQLQPDEPHRLLARVIAKPQSGLQFQLVTVDDRKPESFLFRPDNNKTSLPRTAGSLPVAESPAKTVAAADAPLIKELNTAARDIQFLPLKLAPAVTALVKEAKLPLPLQHELEAAVAGSEMQLAFKAVLPAPLPPQTLKDSPLLEPLRQILQAISVVQDNPAQLPPLIEKFAAQLQNLNGQLLPAVTDIKGQGQVTVFQTPLGQVVSETPLKLAPQTPVMLSVGDTFVPSVIASDTRTLLSLRSTGYETPPPLPADRPPAPLNNLFDRFVELFRQPPEEITNKNPLPPLPETAANPLLASAPSSLHSADLLQNLLNILSPLQDRGIDKLLPHLATRLLDKIPAPNQKLLSNMLSFVKAAEQDKPELWLGRELSAELHARGADGEAVLAKAADFLVNSRRDGISWRMVEIPFLDGSGLGKMRVAFKKTQDDDDNETSPSKRNSGARFIVETEFSRLGSFQFDGFSQAKDRRLDLIIRTGRRLPADLVAQIVTLFKTSLRDLNYVGNISVNVNESFVKLADNVETRSQMKDGVYI